jgi:threonine dehydratase
MLTEGTHAVLARSRLSPQRIEEAVDFISPVFLNTPQFLSEPLSARFGARVVLKVETNNPIGSFKGRGAENYAAQSPRNLRLVCGSAGNFGQALAYSGRARGIRVIVYAAETANPHEAWRE